MHLVAQKGLHVAGRVELLNTLQSFISARKTHGKFSGIFPFGWCSRIYTENSGSSQHLCATMAATKASIAPAWP